MPSAFSTPTALTSPEKASTPSTSLPFFPLPSSLFPLPSSLFLTRPVSLTGPVYPHSPGLARLALEHRVLRPSRGRLAAVFAAGTRAADLGGLPGLLFRSVHKGRREHACGQREEGSPARPVETPVSAWSRAAPLRLAAAGRPRHWPHLEPAHLSRPCRAPGRPQTVAM